MEVINKRHDKILVNTRINLAAYMRIEEKMMYFSAACNVHLGLTGGLYMHFINDDDRWLFYVNSDKDGFETIHRHPKLSFLVANTHLCNLFLKRTRCSLKNKFPIEKTEAKMKDAPIYEIMINKVFEPEY